MKARTLPANFSSPSEGSTMMLPARGKPLTGLGFIALVICVAGATLSPRLVFGQALQVMYTLNDGLGNGTTTDAVNAPVTTQAAVSGAQTTIYVWGLVTDTGVADNQLGLSLAFLNAESAQTGTGAFSTGSGIGLTAPMTLASAWSNGGASGTLTNSFGLSGVESLGSTSAVKTTAQPLQAEPSDGINFEFGGGTASTTGMPYGTGSALGTGGWAFLLGTMTFTQGTTGASYTGTTSLVPLVPAYTAAKDAFTTSTAGNPSGLASESTVAWTSAGGVTFTAPLSTGNSSVLNLTPATTTTPNSNSTISLGNLLAGATVSSSALTNMNLASTAATTYSSSLAATVNGTAINGSPSSSATGAQSLGGFAIGDANAGTFLGSGTNSLTVSLNGSEAVGTDVWTYTVANGLNSSDSNGGAGSSSNKTVTINAQVGTALAINNTTGTDSFSGATVLSASIVNGTSYAGLSSNSGTKASNGSSLAGTEGTTATILFGTNNQGSTMTPSMAWRIRTLSEAPTNDSVNSGFANGTNTKYSAPLAGLPLISDVVNLYGMSASSTGTVGAAPVQTDPFVFQMSFNPATLVAEGATNGNAGTKTQGDLADRGNVYLASLIGGTWQNTIYGDLTTFTPITGASAQTVNGKTALFGVDAYKGGASPYLAVGTNDSTDDPGSFAAFEATENAIYGTNFVQNNIGDFLGSWGVDTISDQAWAVVAHNSEFAVVPEPSSIVLAAFGVLGGLWAVRRRKIAAAA